MIYVTYDEDGKLTGCYSQELHADHLNNHIEISENQKVLWVSYKANAQRDGVELMPVVIDLVAQRKTIIDEIKAERDRRKFNGVNVAGKWIHTDTYSRTQWMSMVMMGASIPSVQWTTMDLTTVTTSQALAGQVFQAVAALDAALFAHSGALVAQILASNDPKSIDIMTGWTPTFGE